MSDRRGLSYNLRPATFFLLALCTPLAFADSSKIIYTKFFKGSKPEFVSITLERSGQTIYKEAPDDENPVQFQMAESDTHEIFDLADRLDHFKRQLESGLKVAHMGIKTFRFEDGAAANEVKFNYSEDPNARALNDWFERITETEQHYIALDRAAHFDKLGVNQVLLEIQVTYDRKRLMAPQQFLPLLDRVSNNESYLHLARARAAGLAEAFRKNLPAAAPVTAEEKAQK